ncbi:MAG: phosphoglycerate kinase [Deltaproteobacteria bacterium]|nr:phosphoglycerate kinase [Deltaproteobacteria bacterium]
MNSPLSLSLKNEKFVFRRLEDLRVTGRRVFVRADFNVPLVPSQASPTGMSVADDARIRGALPTIQWLSDAGARVVLASHLGRPSGRDERSLSMEPVGISLSEHLRKDVVFSGECDLTQVRHLVNGLKGGGMLLLENLRYWAGEEENSPDFSRQLSLFTDVYINDAFGSVHRLHASTVGLPALVSEKGIGRLVEQELIAFSAALSNPARPFLLIIGGAKLSDKLPVIEHLIESVDACCIGGAMAYTFLAAQGHRTGKSPVDRANIGLVRRVMERAERRGVAIYLPQDHVMALDLKGEGPLEISSAADISDDFLAFDIGPHTVEQWSNVIAEAKSIIWNGPLGVFEQERFAKGTLAIAQAVAEGNAFKIVGGGDSLAAIRKSGYESLMSHCSTGGGAMLKLLSGASLPALKVLNEAHP